MKIYLYDFETEIKYHEFNDVYKLEIAVFKDYEYAIVNEIFGDVQVGDICYFVHLCDGCVFVFNYYEFMLNIPIKKNLSRQRSNYFILKE